MTGRLLRVSVAGAGNVGAGLVHLIQSSRTLMAEQHDLDLRVVALVDADGGIVDEEHGVDLGPHRSGPEARIALPTDPRWRPGLAVPDLWGSVAVDVHVEATPLDVVDAQPALRHITQALEAGCHVVTANKGPLALAFAELERLATTGDRVGHRPFLRFSACVAGALPVLSVGTRDLAGESIERFEAVLNGTSHWVLHQMASGQDLSAAVAEAQRMGIAETDPSLDLSGLDAACKLVIVANAIFGLRCVLGDIPRTGVDEVDPDALAAARTRGATVLPLAWIVRRPGGGFDVGVGPREVPESHPLARLRPSQMGVVFATPAVPELALTSDEPSALPASSALLRDILEIHRKTTR